MAIGKGNTPFEANMSAYDARKTGRFLNRETRIFGQTMSLSSSLTSNLGSSDELSR